MIILCTLIINTIIVFCQMLIPQLDPLTEQQLMGIYSLQQSSQQAEEALSQGLDQLQQSLVETIAGGSIVDGMQQMGMAMGKLANLEGFVRQVKYRTIHLFISLREVWIKISIIKQTLEWHRVGSENFN